MVRPAAGATEGGGVIVREIERLELLAEHARRDGDERVADEYRRMAEAARRVLMGGLR